MRLEWHIQSKICEARTKKMSNEEAVMSEDTQLSTELHA